LLILKILSTQNSFAFPLLNDKLLKNSTIRENLLFWACEILPGNRKHTDYMALKTFVKISNISNLSDARYCAGMGVDVLGFRLDPFDPASIDPARFKGITEWVSGVGFAGEFYQSNADVIAQTSAKYNLSYLQIQPAALTEQIVGLNIPIIISLNLDDYPEMNRLKEYMQRTSHVVEFFLVSSGKNEWEVPELDNIIGLTKEFPILMGYGITKHNVNQIIDTLHVKGIAMEGGEEVQPGFKDYDELMDILEEIEVE
jgi:phosphoribosylanthranilate isomerase